MPLLSFVMPVKDGASYIEEAVRSLQSQALRDWELVVVDDHSADDSAGRAARLAASDGRIRVVANPAPAAGAVFQNTGRQHGSGVELEAVWDASRSLRLSAGAERTASPEDAVSRAA